MENDTRQLGIPQLSSDVQQQRRLKPRRQSRQHASWSEQSTLDDGEREWFNPVAVSYHHQDIKSRREAEDVDEMESIVQRSYVHSNERDSPSEPFAIPEDSVAPSPVSVGRHDSNVRRLDCSIPLLEQSNVSADRDLSHQQNIVGGNNFMFASKSMVASESVAASTQTASCFHFEPVIGKLADLPDNNLHLENDDECDDDEGIVILDESTEEGDFPTSLASDDAPQEECTESYEGVVQASMYDKDSIVLAVAARVNVDLPSPDDGNASLDFEQLLQEAGDLGVSGSTPRASEEDELQRSTTIDESPPPAENSWRNPFALWWSKRTAPKKSLAAPTISLHTPVRATRIRHDKYVVEMDIFPEDVNDSWFDVRDVLDVMANIELLHLWFDPVPAVFDAVAKDGSGDGMLSPRPLPTNSSEDDGANGRQYDGSWVEISTPLLSIPSDSRVSRFLRTIRVGLRSVIGFPARIRSMIFVERSSGRIGMTLGPYPDGFMFGKGTMAYHTFEVRMSDEESASAEGRRHVVVSDEVRLKRGGDDLEGATRTCFVCSIFRFFLRVLECAFFFRYYQPDLASYMEQTISSLEKLRTLVERGESAAYAGGALIIEDGGDEGDRSNNLMGTPLLGHSLD